MIKIIIDEGIISKHRKYLLKKDASNNLYLIERLKRFQKKGDFFNIEYLNKLVDVRRKTNKLDEKFFLKYFSDKKRKQLLKQHYKFIKYLINEVSNLEQCEEYEEYKKCKDCRNIFLGKPRHLNEKKEEIEKRFSYITNFIKLQSLADNKKEKIKTTYAFELTGILGYYEFADESMNFFYKFELDRIKELKDYKKYKHEMGIYQNPGKYSVSMLNRIKRYILDDIDNMLSYDPMNKDLKDFIQIELYDLIRGFPVSDGSGKSIGVGDFEKEIEEIIDSALKEFIKNEKFSSTGITHNNIDIYNKKYDKKWGAYQFLMDLGIKSCPYCNRQYISPLYTQKGKLRADLDHFYNKSTYPYLSVSLFNLVPSCKFCNSSLKGKQNFTYSENLNPYEDGFGDRLKFSFSVKSYADFLGDSKLSIFLRENISDSQEDKAFITKAKKNASAFQIENLYSYHYDEAMDLIKKRIEYSDDYIEMLVTEYNRKIYRNEKEVIEALIGYKVENEALLEKNLTKFTRDICEEIGFIFRDGVVSNSNEIDSIFQKYKK